MSIQIAIYILMCTAACFCTSESLKLSGSTGLERHEQKYNIRKTTHKSFLNNKIKYDVSEDLFYNKIENAPVQVEQKNIPFLRLKMKCLKIINTIRNSKTYLVAIIATSAIFTLFMIMCIVTYIMSKWHLLALNNCNSMIENNAYTCYIQNGRYIELLSPIGYNQIDYTNVNSTTALQPVCAATVSTHAENANQSVLRVIEDLCYVTTNKILLPISRYIKNNLTLSGESIPTKKEITDIATLLSSSIHNEMPSSFKIALNSVDITPYYEILDNESIHNSQVCWSGN
ncbi:hypothetical protein NEIG_01611 [Nematocida sp. ERTm5]|nr:hypothetical protein NEIG_01611 [Nematocida sp. ERTm5]